MPRKRTGHSTRGSSRTRPHEPGGRDTGTHHVGADQVANGADNDKVGSEPAAAQQVGGKGDFGVPPDRTRDREYVSNSTKMQDKGGGAEHAGADADRTSGVGGHHSGVGSSSGGDLDPDIIGVGTGGGIAQSGGTDRTEGPDMATGTSDDFASGGHARGENQQPRRERVRGTTVSRDHDVSTGGDAQSNAAVTNPNARGDDSFAGEVSDDEASGAIESQ